MINTILTFGAVPFGYTSDLFESDHDLPFGEQCLNMNFHNFRGPNGLPPLPDLILSNTPPPSPLRRAHSYHFLFPEKNEENQGRTSLSALERSLSFLPTPPPTPTSPQSEGQEGNFSYSRGEEDRDVDGVRTRLNHIQEIRRRLRDPAAHFQPHQQLPQLSWEVPSVQRSRRTDPRLPPQPLGAEGENNGKEGRRRKEVGKESDQRLRQIGTDLRRIADQFEVDNGKVCNKNGKKDESGLAWTVPVAFTRCLSVSLLCLVWWRLINKLQ